MQASRRRFLAASAVLIAGTAAALPFYHADPHNRPAKATALTNPDPREMVSLQIAGEALETKPLPNKAGSDTASPADATDKANSNPAAAKSVPQLSNVLPTAEKQVPPASAIVRTTSASSGNPTATESAEVRQRLHRIADGDTLQSLARRFLGDESRWQEIRDANRDILVADDILPIGKELRIPPRAAQSTSADKTQSTSTSVGLVPIP